MNIRKNILLISLLVAVCVPTGLISSVQSQDSPRKKTVPPEALAPSCPKGKLVAVIDLCQPVGHITGGYQSQANPEKQIELRKHDHTSLWFRPHVDYRLRATQDQVAWTCKGKSFQILSIEGILDPDNKQVPPPVPPFPFCQNLQDQIVGKVVQAPGTILYSGTPIMEAKGNCYKYSYVYGEWDAIHKTFDHPVTVDPHLIVTGPDPAVQYKSVLPSNPPSKKCVFSERVVPRNPD